MKYVIAILMVLGYTASSQAGTVYVGYKDNAGPSVDYDYNDLIFSLTSNSLQLSAAGLWQFKPTLSGDAYNSANAGLQNTPYWNNSSYDGPQMGIGWCIYGGGNCNGGVGLDPTADYLTTNPNSPFGSVTDVTFTSTGSVGASIALKISTGTNLLGWYAVSDPSTIYWLNSPTTPLVTTSFTPTGAFGLVAENVSLGMTFYSQTSVGGTQDSVSHFAFFADGGNMPTLNSDLVSPTAPTPEPTSWLLGLSGFGFLFWKLRDKRRA